jgi:hypothetical protein
MFYLFRNLNVDGEFDTRGQFQQHFKPSFHAYLGSYSVSRSMLIFWHMDLNTGYLK